MKPPIKPVGRDRRGNPIYADADLPPGARRTPREPGRPLAFQAIGLVFRGAVALLSLLVLLVMIGTAIALW